MLTGRVNAPEINTRHGWLNTRRSYTLKDFRGKLVLLDFWTYGCINCQHLLPDIQRLEKEYARELVVIGVHSAKFTAEKHQEAIRQAILKFGITHPVVNDADSAVWKQYAVRAWPTVVLIDPNGKVVGQRSGEGIYDEIKPHLDHLIQVFDDQLDRAPFLAQLETTAHDVLRFPSKLVADAKAGHLFVADSGNHRILELDTTGQVLTVIGKGNQGFQDGNFAQATFNEPHGLALHGDFLYVADAKNNALRKVNLRTQQVTTAAGTGELSYYFFEDQWGVPVLPNSPWDLALDRDQLYIASAGNHQILRFDLATEKVYRFAGTGREALADGHLHEAVFSQPSGLALVNRTLYVADPEASAIRALHLDSGIVTTLIGWGLFDFGDVDATFDEAYLQHPLGLAAYGNHLYLADTYNGKIKVLDLVQKQIKTLVSGLQEPNGLVAHQDHLWFTNTNAHQLCKLNLETNAQEIVPVRFE